jgi:hypothetical protein
MAGVPINFSNWNLCMNVANKEDSGVLNMKKICSGISLMFWTIQLLWSESDRERLLVDVSLVALATELIL